MFLGKVFKKTCFPPLNGVNKSCKIDLEAWAGFNQATIKGASLLTLKQKAKNNKNSFKISTKNDVSCRKSKGDDDYLSMFIHSVIQQKL
jgi:hypothetical protein